MKWFREFASSLTIGLSLFLFAASLKFPAFVFREHEPVIGGSLLFFGWIGILTGDFGWLANPAYLLALGFLYFGTESAAKVFSGIAVLLGLLSLRTQGYYFDESGRTPIDKFGFGLYIWLASFFLLQLYFWMPYFSYQHDDGK